MNKVTLVSVLLILSIAYFASGLKVVTQNEAKTLACCGASSYDTTTQTCCSGTVNSLPGAGSNLVNVCCGTRLLTTAQTCCRADPLVPSSGDRAVPVGSTCCGVNVIDTATQLCCAGTVVSNPQGTLQCCGNKGFNPAADLCCATSDLRVQGCTVTPVATITVVTGAAAQNKQCCGNSAFDPTTQVCCPTPTDADARAVTNSGGTLTCCGSTTFNAATQTCCSVTVTEDYQDEAGNVVQITTTQTGVTTTGAGLQCCGTKGFTSTQLCCGGSILNNANNDQQCCGNAAKTFNPTTQTCCAFDTDNFETANCNDIDDCPIFVNVPKGNANVATIASGQCCGNTPFDPTTSICCNGKVNVNPNGFSCCGTGLYDPANDVCCPDTIVPYGKTFKGKASSAEQCCGVNLFDPVTQACPCGVVIPSDQDLIQTNRNPNVNPGCCGATQYDANHKLCCPEGPYLFDLDPAAGLQCCQLDGKTVYNPAYQVCCKKSKFSCAKKPSTSTPSIVVPTPKPATNSPSQDKVQCGDSCCNGVGYFANYQRCCNDEVLDFNSALDASTSPMACCGTDVYNVIYESCCIEALNDFNSASVKFKANYAVFGGPGNWQICCLSN
jgi:hypothetical protein